MVKDEIERQTEEMVRRVLEQENSADSTLIREISNGGLFTSQSSKTSLLSNLGYSIEEV
jgi:hypothetical protein